MKFYNEKLREIRKQKKIRVDALAFQAGVTRNTLWFWESGRIIPAEDKIRQLAKALNVPVDMISDLKSNLAVSEAVIPSHINALLHSFICADMSERKKQQDYHLESIRAQYNELNQITTIINTFLNSIQIIFYAKSILSEYIVANQAFLKNVSLDNKFKVFKHTDENFFPKKEAQKNKEEDEQVIFTGKPITYEGYIPGSKQRKWGIISKVPIFDFFGKIAGMLGYFVDTTEKRNSELLIEELKKGLEIMDEVIWMGRKPKETPEGIRFDENLYLIRNRFLKKIFNIKDDMNLNEIVNYGKTLIQNKKNRKKINLELLKKNRVAEVKFKVRSPLTHKILNFYSKYYYDPDSDLYVSINKIDKETELIEKATEKLRQLGVDEKIIKKVFVE